jgi:hypothetical protein
MVKVAECRPTYGPKNIIENNETEISLLFMWTFMLIRDLSYILLIF